MCACFDLIINKLMLGLFCFAGVIPEVDFIPAIFAKMDFDHRG